MLWVRELGAQSVVVMVPYWVAGKLQQCLQEKLWRSVSWSAVHRGGVLLLLQSGLILHYYFLVQFCFNMAWKFTLLFEFTNNFWFNTIWQRRCVAALILRRRLAESDFTVTPSVTHVDWSHWWCNYTGHATSSSTALAFLTNMSEKCKFTSYSAIQVKNQWNTTSNEEKLDANMKKANELLTYAKMLDSLTVAYVLFMIMPFYKKYQVRN